MAQRIDNGVHPAAHTAVHAMIVRAQQAADQTGKTVGVHYDLQSDEVSLVEIGPDMPADVTFLRVAVPANGVAVDNGSGAPAGAEDTAPEIKAEAA
jgi:hypothetical protein